MPAFQYWFTGAALIGFLALLGNAVAFAGLGYGWYRAAVTEQNDAIAKDKKEKTTQTHARALDHITALIAEANQIEGFCLREKTDIEPLKARGKAWIAKAATQLRQDLGEPYAVQFLNALPYPYVAMGMQVDLTGTYQQTKGKKDALVALITELRTA